LMSHQFWDGGDDDVNGYVPCFKCSLDLVVLQLKNQMKKLTIIEPKNRK
jgi:hypothetical protein